MDVGDLLIGAALGAGGFYLWRKLSASGCGCNDTTPLPGGGSTDAVGAAASLQTSQPTAATQMTASGAKSSILGGKPATSSIGRGVLSIDGVAPTRSLAAAKKQYGQALARAIALNVAPKPQLPAPSTDMPDRSGLIVQGNTAGATGANAP